MIFFEGLHSIIECIYLNDTLSDKIGSCNVFINPENIKYLTGRTVIVNDYSYPIENIEQLIDNNCKVISRIYSDVDGVDVQPYITRINFNVMWNGRILNELEDLEKDEVWEQGGCSFSLEDYILYFPKIKILDNDPRIIDSYGNLSALGWALHQVGINLDEKTPFSNLDILKTKKINL